MITKRKAIALAAMAWCLAMAATPARGIVLSLTNEAVTLQDAFVQINTGVVIQGLVVEQPRLLTVGTYTNATDTYGIPGGIAMSTGDLRDYGDSAQQSTQGDLPFHVAATTAQNADLSPISGAATNFDASQINVTFDMLPGYDTIRFMVVFGSEEYPDFIGGAYSDGFGAYLNGANVALVNGLPVNVKHANVADVPGTILNGILTNADGPSGPYVHEFTGVVGGGSTGNTLRLILGDAGDSIVDSTVYIAQFQGIQASPPPIAGDFNGDSVVNAADLAAWKGDFGVNGASDSDGDGDSDGADFLAWQQQLNAPVASAHMATAPEPSAVVLTAAAATTILLPRRLTSTRQKESKAL